MDEKRRVGSMECHYGTCCSYINDIYPDKCDRCGGQVSSYPNTFDEHVIEDVEIKS